MPYLFGIWIILSAALLFFFLYAAYVNFRRKKRPQVDLSDVVPYFLPVDVEALRELIGPQAKATFSQTYSKQDFHSLRRKHIRQALEYLRRLRHHAALLRQVGLSRIHSTNPLVASQAKELVDAGTHVRLMVTIAIFVMLLRSLAVLFSRCRAPGKTR